MDIRTVLLPLFVQVALTLILYCWMAFHRITMFRKGMVKASEVALREPNWPTHALKVVNACQNQLEIPVLFYVLTILSIITRHADLLFVVLAWLFVLLRIAHAYIHVTSNRVQLRGPVFGAGLMVLIVMWLVFAVRILLGVP